MSYTDYIRPGLLGSTEPMHGLGDLALALGGSEDSFTGDLLRLIVKAQSTPANYARLLIAFPREVRMGTTPAPTGDELLAALDREGC